MLVPGIVMSEYLTETSQIWVLSVNVLFDHIRWRVTIIYLEFSPEYSTKESSTLISSVRVIFVVESCRGYSQHVTITASSRCHHMVSQGYSFSSESNSETWHCWRCEDSFDYMLFKYKTWMISIQCFWRIKRNDITGYVSRVIKIVI